MNKNNKEELDMEIFRHILDKLINDQKIKFTFYKNSLVEPDLLQICYDKRKNILVLEFRDVMGEYLIELKKIMKKE